LPGVDVTLKFKEIVPLKLALPDESAKETCRKENPCPYNAWANIKNELAAAKPFTEVSVA
jgi:hypothetical protein